jgi:hypothetical protein
VKWAGVNKKHHKRILTSILKRWTMCKGQNVNDSKGSCCAESVNKLSFTD